jgi:hypothetical protein
MRIIIFVLMLYGVAAADRDLPDGSQCRPGWDTCQRDSACRGGYCTRVRNIPIGGDCNPGGGDRCVKDAACRSARCVRVRNIPIGGQCQPALGDSCVQGARCRGGYCDAAATTDPLAWLFVTTSDATCDDLVEVR